MARLVQLLDGDYRPCDWDLRADPAGWAYWDRLFRWHLDEVLVPLIREEFGEPPADRLAALRADYLALFDGLRARPDEHERIDVLHFTELRRAALVAHGFEDPFRGLKRRENEQALALLPGVLAELDAAPPAAQRELLLTGLMAGNIFDLGSAATIQLYRDGTMAFRATRAAQPPHPWLHDDAAGWWARWESAARGAYRHVVFFVDNAGGDIVLGCLPLARWMVRAGARVTLAANSAPALNDITADELSPLLQRSAALDATLGAAVDSGLLRVAATGCVTPLIDLERLSDEFVQVAADADLLILHGMGRAIESNFHARFGCDVVHAAVLKDATVAQRLGGKVFDCVLRFKPGAQSGR